MQVFAVVDGTRMLYIACNDIADAESFVAAMAVLGHAGLRIMALVGC